MSTNTNYTKFSPYKITEMYGRFLGLINYRKITKNTNDKLYQIDKSYHLRPDLLAYDLYGDATLWWVFAARNMDVLKDPLFDFLTGNRIYLPNKQTLVLDLE